MNRRLYRSADDRVLAGVAGGMAETYDFDPALVRIAWALLILFSGGTLLLLYIVMAIVIPLAPDTPETGYWPASTPPGTDPALAAAGGDEPTTIGGPAAPAPPMSERERRRMMRQQRRAGGGLAGPVVFGLVLIAIGAFFLLRQYVPAIDWAQVWPIGLIVLGAVLLIAALVPRSRV